ncbi:MAG TPA: type II toxin-antitoxin system VapC family toxin [Candidatus Saccharimonadia bacterium]|nr:type II toxin-antitoxin system VapC family toxin [Candidatus Saccharimonadia bacterium]
MKVLLDSHVFLWVLNDPELIGPKSLGILQDSDTQLFVSAVSIWELGLKYKKKRQPYSITELLDGVQDLNATFLKLESGHLKKFENIDLEHKDPFDMLLVAQSEAEFSTFMTVDKSILGSQSRYLIADASK